MSFHWGYTSLITMLSQIAAPAICARMNRPLNNGSSPRNSRLSLVPRSAISPATGTGNSIATDSSIGNDKLNATLDMVVGTGIRSTPAMATIQMMICHVGPPVWFMMLGSRMNEIAMNPMMGSATASSQMRSASGRGAGVSGSATWPGTRSTSVRSSAGMRHLWRRHRVGLPARLAHRGDDHDADAAVREDVAEADRLFDRRRHGDRVPEVTHQVVVRREVVLWVRVVLEIAEELSLVRSPQRVLGHGHAPVDPDDEKVAQHAGQDHQEPEHTDVLDREHDQ